MLRRALLRAGLLVFAVLSWKAPLAFADTSLVATGSATTGYSSNILSVPESEDPNARPVEADGFMNLAPGLAAAYEVPRGVHNLLYTFGALLFLSHPEANSYSNTLSYQALLALSPRSTLRLGAGFNSGRINGFDQAGTEVVDQGDVLPDGDVEFLSYNANASYRRLLSEQWTGEASLNVARFQPTNEGGGANQNIEQRSRLERGFRYHLLGVDLRLAVNQQGGPELERSLTVGPGLFWTWNVTESISTNSSAGVDVVGEYPNMARGITVPRGSFALTYSHERGRATAGVARGVTINLFGGDTNISTDYFLNLGLPLPTKWPIGVATSAIYSSGEILDIDAGDTRGTTERISADASLLMQINRAWRLGVRVQSSKQVRNEVLMMEEFNAKTRQTVGTIVLVGRFPETVAAQVPTQSSDRVESGNTAFEQRPAE